MAQKITVALEYDLDGGPADQTVRFGLDGAEYENDLSTGTAAAFRAQLALSPNVPARPAGGRAARPCAAHQTVSAAAGSGRGRELRASRSATAAGSPPA
jgi:hypothetical protein